MQGYHNRHLDTTHRLYRYCFNCLQWQWKPRVVLHWRKLQVDIMALKVKIRSDVCFVFPVDTQWTVGWVCSWSLIGWSPEDQQQKVALTSLCCSKWTYQRVTLQTSSPCPLPSKDQVYQHQNWWYTKVAKIRLCRKLNLFYRHGSALGVITCLHKALQRLLADKEHPKVVQTYGYHRIKYVFQKNISFSSF